MWNSTTNSSVQANASTSSKEQSYQQEEEEEELMQESGGQYQGEYYGKACYIEILDAKKKKKAKGHKVFLRFPRIHELLSVF